MPIKKRKRELPDMVFRITSTGCIIKLVAIEEGSKDIYRFKYLNRAANRANSGQDKPDFTTYLSEIQRNEGFNTWIRLTEYTMPNSPADGESLLTVL